MTEDERVGWHCQLNGHEFEHAWPGAPSPSEPGRPVRGASRLRRCSGDRQNPHQPPPQLRPSSGDSANQPGSQMGGREDLRGAPGLGSPREEEA